MAVSAIRKMKKARGTGNIGRVVREQRGDLKKVKERAMQRSGEDVLINLGRENSECKGLEARVCLRNRKVNVIR